MRGWRGGSDAHRYRVGAVRLDARITAGGSQAPQRRARLLSAAGFSMEMTVHPYSVQDAYIYGFALQEWDMLTESAADFAAKAQRQMDEYQSAWLVSRAAGSRLRRRPRRDQLYDHVSGRNLTMGF
jgi:hypothetical protein